MDVEIIDKRLVVTPTTHDDVQTPSNIGEGCQPAFGPRKRSLRVSAKI